MKKQVYIELLNDSYFVMYVGRKFRGHYSAAQFYAPDTTLERVIAWVKANHRLDLVEKPA